jgi:hypothetical protein
MFFFQSPDVRYTVLYPRNLSKLKIKYSEIVKANENADIKFRALLSTRFWNNLQQVRLKPKYLKTKYAKVFGRKNSEGPRQDTKHRPMTLMSVRGAKNRPRTAMSVRGAKYRPRTPMSVRGKF